MRRQTGRYFWIIPLLTVFFLSACGGGSSADTAALSFDLTPVQRTLASAQSQTYNIRVTRQDGQTEIRAAAEAHWLIVLGADSILALDAPGQLRGVAPGLATVRVSYQGKIRDFDFNIF